MKEFDELLVRDPEAAKEKLAELETMRILVRSFPFSFFMFN